MIGIRSILIFAIISLLMSGPISATDTFRSSDQLMSGDTYIEEDIVVDTLWGVLGSPFYVNDTILVRNGARLTIDAGVEVRFGAGAELIVNGNLTIGTTGDPVILRPDGPLLPSAWRGVVLRGCGSALWNNIIVQGANISLSIDNSSYVDIKNTTFALDFRSISLVNGSTASVGNCSLNISKVSILDTNSTLLTYGYLTANVVNYRFQAESGFKFEMFDVNGALVRSHILDQTGRVPTDMIRGRTLCFSGWNSTSGTYTVSITNSTQSYTREISFTMLDHTPMNVTFRYFRPPEIVGLPWNVEVLEDQFYTIGVDVIDHNGAGSLAVSTSTEGVRFQKEESVFTIFYSDEAVLQEEVFINVSDGMDSSLYYMNVTVVPVNDPVHLQLEAEHIIVRENTVYSLGILIVDEDTSLDDIKLTTDDPDNVTFDRNNMTLLLLYGDGTDPEFDVNVSATDGNSTDHSILNVTFQDVNYKPEFITPLPKITLYEDNWTSLDLGPYISDPDKDDTFILKVQSLDIGLFGASVDGTVVSIFPLRDRHGSGLLRLTATDSRSFSSVANINVTIVPVNDAPALVRPGLQLLDSGSFRFNITYTDIEGEPPEYVNLDVDGVDHGMIPTGSGGNDARDGIPYYHIMDLDAGHHLYRFICSDGVEEVSTPFREVVARARYDVFGLDGYDRSLNMTVWTTGDGPPPHLEVDVPIEIIPEGKVIMDCSFIIRPHEREIIYVSIMIELSYFRDDILPLETDLWYDNGTGWERLPGGMYHSLSGLYTMDLSSGPFGGKFALFGGVDLDHDEDGDGYPDRIDAFPFDPDEWIDTDGDGIGDNEDDDDDNDGYNDTIEIMAGSSPYDPNSVPSDLDGDGIIDILDDDIDSDGMDNIWEIENGLDPWDGSDANEDPDGDGLTNLEEYLAGTDPNRKNSDGRNDPSGTYLWVGLALVLFFLVILVIALVMRGHHHDEINEIDIEEEDESGDWEIQGELDPSEAAECDSCLEIYPEEMVRCPFCGSRKRTSLLDRMIME